MVRLTGAIERLLFTDNTVVRPSMAMTGTLMNLSAEPTDYRPCWDEDATPASMSRATHLPHRAPAADGYRTD